MTCHLSKRACIVNLRALRNALTLVDDTHELDDYSADAWNSGWEVDDGSEEIARMKLEDQSWLQECVSSLSPAIDVLAFAYGQQAVFLTSKYDVNEESNTKLKFVSSYEGKLSSDNDDNITSLLCLPLASQKRSLQGGPDWTCIIVGYSSGYLRIYTEKAELLLSQLLHEESVTHLRCKTHVPQHYQNFSEQPEELVIVYSSVVVTIDGFGLFQTLRACRNQLARAAAGRQEATQPPPLTYKKWGFHEHDKLVDCEAAGAVTTSVFDHLVTESIRKGFYGSVKATMTSNSLLVTTGSNPYVGFYHATEGSSQLLLTDVVQAVASKLMNFLSNSNAGGLIGGLIGRSENEQQKNKPKIEPPTVLNLRFGLYDKRRQGFSIALSPNKSLGAITDTFGRVILFDICRGVAIRMWKGYRDAQCGWVEVEDDMPQKQMSILDPDRKKRVFFLVIYAPRRGILEVWCAQQGPRVAAFNVGKSGRLFSPGYTMVGANFSASNLAKQHLSSCFFLDTDGILKKVVVPFHSILSERNSKRVRDLHLLKEVRLSLKNIAKGKTTEVIQILKDIRTSSIRIQALDNVLGSRYSTADLVEEVVSELLSHLQKQDPEQIDHETKLLKQSCVRAQQLVRLYNIINEINLKTNLVHKAEACVDIQLYVASLCISDIEVGRILSMVTLHQTVVPVLKKHVRFLDDSATDLTFPDFMTCFNVSDSHLAKTGEEILTENLPVNLIGSLSDKQIESLGGFLFHTSVHVGACLSTVQTALKDSGVLPEKLLLLLLSHWVSDSGFCGDADKWLNLQQVMKHISSLSDPKFVSSESDHVSPWWKSVREVLLQSTGNVAAYIGAVVARSVSVVMAADFHIEQKNASGDCKSSKDADEKSENGDSDWEAVSLDYEHWNLLVKQLEDVLLLSILLKSQPFGKAVVKDVNISISSILSGGQGMVTDLVAVWAVSVGLQPELLSSFFMDAIEDDASIPSKFVDDNKSDEIQSLVIVKGLINDLRKKFPYSLKHDVLLANCGWEYLIQWSKNKESIDYLTKALSCLNFVGSSVIKNGFSAMMWKSCVQKKFEALCLLIEKVGKTPKERLCKKELELNDNHLENLIDFCCQLLNIILETNVAAEVEDVPNYGCEDLWQDRENQGPAPLILMALGQKISTGYVVFQHWVLASVLQFIVTFQMKNARPLGLFSAITKKALFRELHYNLQLPPEKEDSSLSTLRTKFLLRVASAISQSVPESIPEASDSLAPAESTEDSLCQRQGHRVASKWFNRVINLGRDWELNLDELRRHYVCELYSCGHDLLAEEVITAVNDREKLGSQLLLLSGQRVHIFIYDYPDAVHKIACLSPDVSEFLRNLGDIKLRCNNVPVHLTLILLDQIVSFLPEECREFKLARSIRNGLKMMISLSISPNS